MNKINVGSATKADTEQQAGQTLDAATLANLELYHRNRDNHDVIDAEYFSPATVPQGFEPELRLFPGEPAPAFPPVVI
ncbi:hypothetical protein KC219_26655, partial [Mycobacterium tuberculosis]|nr:hypothetical protein [Mycobacterium tuberculosis]